MSDWTEIQVTRPWTIPDRPGVYVIFYDGEVVYIGQSNNIRSRFYRHQFELGYANNIKTPWGMFPDKITCKVKVSKRRGDWAMWEIRLIHRLKPRHNQRFTGRVKVAAE